MSSKGDALQLLGGVPTFAELPRRSLKKLVRLCTPRDYPAGSVIIEEGATGLGLFVVIEGTAEVFKGHGEARTTLGQIGRGDVVGEIALIDDQPRSASVVATSDTRCLLITRNSFQGLVRREPEIAWCFVPVLSERVRTLHAHVMAAEEEVADGEPTPMDNDGGPAKTESVPETGKRRDEGGSSLLDLLQAQHALARAGLTAASATVGMFDTFLDTLVEETGLDRDDSAGDVVRAVPAGIAKATTAAVTEAEKVPEKMVSALRHHLNRE